MQELFGLHGHGIFLRRDAMAHGYLDRDLARAVARRDLVRVRHGAYVDAQRWEELDSNARHALTSRAVLLTHGGQVALSHVSGAVIHGMRVWGMDLDRVHLSRTGPSASRRHHDIAYHDAPPSSVLHLVDGAQTLSPAHCAVGAAALGSVESGVVTIDSAYHLGLCTVEDIRAAYDAMAGWTGTGRLRVTLPLAEPGSESVGESRARVMFWRHHLPRPRLQYPVHDAAGRLLGITDFAWPEHGLLGEFDGKVKYGQLVPDGASPADVLFREKVREDRIREATGWRFVRLTWFDLEHQERTAARLRTMLR